MLFLSGDEGWNRRADRLRTSSSRSRAPWWWASICRNSKRCWKRTAADCVFPDGDLENLSHFVQAYFHNSTYLAPLLVGLDAGGSMAYAVLAQAPPDTFAGALSSGFCPHLNLEKPLCKGSGLELTHGCSRLRLGSPAD